MIVFTLLLLAAAFVLISGRPSSAATTLTLTPVADAHISSRQPNANFGQSSVLYVSPEMTSYIQFNTSGVNGSVKQASLWLFNEKGTITGVDVKAVSDVGWQENTLTYSNAPKVGATISSAYVTKSGKWTEVDVTPLLLGDGGGSVQGGAVALAIVARGSKEGRFTSGEGSANRQPMLVLEMDSGLTSPPSTPTVGSTATQQGTSSPSTTSTPEPTATRTPLPTATPSPVSGGGTVPIGTSVNFGVYDFAQTFGNSKAMAVQHEFVSWLQDSYQQGLLTTILRDAPAKGRWPLVTVEPFVASGRQSSNLLEDIVAGYYDSNIRWVCEAFRDSGQPMFVRWGHEMENVTGRYPWAVNDAGAFIAAYRYFVDQCRSITGSSAQIYYVWSPAGNNNLSKYWPGSSYADYVGLSVYGYPAWDMDYYGKVRSFEEVFAERYGYVQGFGRPVMIAEMGVTGDAEYQRKWVSDGLQIVGKYPLLKTMVYFNAKDPVAWGSKYPAPDWRIDPAVFDYAQ